jgi:hypothetical protein
VVRIAIAVVATYALSTVGVGILTFESIGFWWNAITQGIGFILGACLAARIARRDALLAVAIGMALTWGMVAVTVLSISIQHDGTLRAPGVLMVWVALSLLLAYRIGSKYRNQVVLKEKAPLPPDAVINT